jgi:hypothetical protein
MTCSNCFFRWKNQSEIPGIIYSGKIPGINKIPSGTEIHQSKLLTLCRFAGSVRADADSRAGQIISD